MTLRLPLTARIMLLAAANVLVLVVLGAIFVEFELGREFDSMLLSTARERLLAVGRAFALDLAVTPDAQRAGLAERYSNENGLRVFLASNDGRIIIGNRADVPPEMLARIQEGRGGRGGPGRGGPPPFEGPSPGLGVPPLPTT